MYAEYFGLKEKPFNMTPDPKYYFPSGRHREALDSLLYAVSERKGFVVVSGEVGAGKTTICRTLLNQLGENTTLAMVTNTYVTSKQLLEMILDEYEIEHNGGTKHKLLSKLNHFLINQLAEDRNVLLIIDEAQNLSTKCLEEVRMLSNLETETDKLIQIILMGQPELRDKLRLSSMLQLKQRIAVAYHLTPLDREETKNYVKYRLNVAALNGKDHSDLFTNDALDLVYESSQGIPRIINNICDNALLSVYALGGNQVDRKVIQDATGDILIHDVDHMSDEERKQTQNDSLNASLNFNKSSSEIEIEEIEEIEVVPAEEETVSDEKEPEGETSEPEEPGENEPETASEEPEEKDVEGIGVAVSSAIDHSDEDYVRIDLKIDDPKKKKQIIKEIENLESSFRKTKEEENKEPETIRIKKGVFFLKRQKI